MHSKKFAFLATTALIGNAFVGGAAHAQSTGTRAAESRDVVIVTGNSGPPAAGPAIAQEIDKTRSTIDSELIERQNPGQTILQSLNIVPGLNFTNSDPYGNSGGNIRLRGFDGNRVGLAFDGMPLNDTGNYASFTNQLLDPELIVEASVNQGSTDVDSPTAAAIGGIINFVSANPDDTMGAQVVGSYGDFNYGRLFVRLDSGEIGPWGTKAYITGSTTRYDKFKGPGKLEKDQYNAKIYQPLNGNDFISIAAHYNKNRNAFYNNTANLVKDVNGKTVIDRRGPFPENDQACTPPTAVNGTAQNENTGSTAIRYDGTTLANTSCTNFYGVRINPSETGNIRINSSFDLTDYLTLTVDPSFQYVMANGGGYTGTIFERDNRLDQNNANNAAACLAGANLNGGVDLNGDGDSCDTVALYTPSNTNTRRYGVLASLIWKVNDDNQLRVSYTNDYGRHRQTGEAIDLGTNSQPREVFGGKESWGDPALRVTGLDGSFYRSRDRFSLAILNQLSVDYFGSFLDDSLTIAIGARAPQFKRELNQYCYSQNGSTNVLCTTQPVTTTLANGNVQFAGDSNQYIAPYKQEFTYNKILPNITAGYAFGDSKVYASYSEQIAVPRTDNLYIASRNATATTLQPLTFNSVAPELSKNYEAGYRFTTNDIVASASVYLNQYSNRVVSTIDNDPTSSTFLLTIDRNVGKVETKGFEGSLGWSVTDTFSLYGSATYTDARLQENQDVGTFVCPAVPPTTGNGANCVANQRYPLLLPTKGKQVVETPEWMYTARADWEMNDLLSFGLQAKYVGPRFTTDVNDEQVPSYTTLDFDARMDLTSFTGFRDTYLQFNLTNVTDEVYPVNISSGTNAQTIADVNPDATVANNRTGALRTFGIAAPRTALLTLGAKF
ncbi:MAG: TonB-dependent receptor [Hyphomonadaceae bacterium]